MGAVGGSPFHLLPDETIFMFCEKIIVSEGPINPLKPPTSSFPYVCTLFYKIYQDAYFRILYQQLVSLSEIISLEKTCVAPTYKESCKMLYKEMHPSECRYWSHEISQLLGSTKEDAFEDKLCRVKNVVALGLNPHQKCPGGHNPLFRICNYISWEIIGKTEDEEYDTITERCCKVAQFFIEIGINPNECEAGASPLLKLMDHQPCTRKDIECVKAVIQVLKKGGAKPDLRPPSSFWISWHYSPIEYARRKYPVLLKTLETT